MDIIYHWQINGKCRNVKRYESFKFTCVCHFIFRTQRHGILALTRDKQDQTEWNGNITRKQGVSGSSKNHVFVDRIDRIQGKTWMENWKSNKVKRESTIQVIFTIQLSILPGLARSGSKKFYDCGCLVKKEFDRKKTSEWRQKSISMRLKRHLRQVVWFVGINQQLCSVEGTISTIKSIVNPSVD
jgi:hypothetical protein